MSFEGKNLYGQYIDYSEKKKKWPKGFIYPYTGTIFYNIRIYSRSQVSVYRTIGPLVLFLIQNIDCEKIDCGYTLEQPRGGSSNVFPRSFFFAWRDSVKQLKRNEDFSSICGVFPSVCGVSL